LDKNFTVKQVEAALLAIRPKISEPQMSMLRALYYHGILSMERIAFFGGYGKDNTTAGNGAFGALCKKIARQLGDEDLGTSAIASGAGEDDSRGYFQWRMDDVVTKAIRQLGWFPVLPETKQETDSPSERRTAQETEREALTKARIGQGRFRIDVIAVWECCAVTGCALSQILVASHIVPWKDATDTERLDPFNGLLLTPNLDRLFDQCLVAFNDDGSILLSKSLSAEMKTALGVNEQCKLRFVRPAMLPYLQRHRALFHKREGEL